MTKERKQSYGRHEGLVVRKGAEGGLYVLRRNNEGKMYKVYLSPCKKNSFPCPSHCERGKPGKSCANKKRTYKKSKKSSKKGSKSK